MSKPGRRSWLTTWPRKDLPLRGHFHLKSPNWVKVPPVEQYRARIPAASHVTGRENANGQRLFLAQSYGIHAACRRGDHGRRAADILLWLARRLDRSRQSSRDDRGPHTDACRFREPDDRHPALAVTSIASECWT